MKNILPFILSLIIYSCQLSQNPSQMSIEKVVDANKQLYISLNAMFNGQFELISNVWSHSDTITYMGPFGGKLVGWDAIGKDFQQVTDMKIGGQINPEEVSVVVTSEMAYVTCFEVGENIGPDGQVVKVRHRATNIFQLLEGEWKLVHHHTDIAESLENAYDKKVN